NYKYSVLPLCPEILVRRGDCICSKTFLYSSFIRNKRKNLFSVTGVDTAIKTVLISYRGTISLKNMMTDFDCELIQYPVAKEGVLVHKGIYEAITALQYKSEEAVYPLLKNPKYKVYKFLITGYSLGAAMATISSLRWRDFLKENKLNNQMKVLAYLSPRVGNEGLA
ncbi:alpha/beta-hydrolase, partial [Neoconidiobolus thromboides FSU 785]